VAEARRGGSNAAAAAAAAAVYGDEEESEAVSVGDDRECAVCREYVKVFCAILPPSQLIPYGGSTRN
jgi:hypothetical protein